MTPSQLRVMNDALNHRALMRHARGRLDALWPPESRKAPVGEAAYDLAGWLAVEALYSRSLATFLGIDRKSGKRPVLIVPRSRLEEDATLAQMGKPLLKIATLDRTRSEILWDGLDAAHREFAHLRSVEEASPRENSDRLHELRVTIRRFSLLVDELFSREL